MSRSLGGAVARAVAWSWDLDREPPPPSARAAVGRSVLDAIGCAVAAARTAGLDHLLSVAHRTAGSGPATALDGTAGLSVEDAALANGILVHDLDLDDIHADSPVHVSAAVLPGSLAVAEQVDASGPQFLTAYLSGAEVVARLGLVAPSGFRERGFHPTPVLAVSGTALAVARLRGLDPSSAAHAVGIAGSLAAGSTASFAAAGTRHLYVGLAARNAILAADLAAAGADGPRDIWEGRGGLFEVYAGTIVGADDLVGDLGRVWLVERLVLKRAPCHHLATSAVDAACTLRRDGLTADRIREVVAVVHPSAVGVVCATGRDSGAHPDGWDRFRDPDTADEARVSLPWCVAAAVIDGHLGLSTFDPASIRRHEVLALAGRVRCEAAEHAHGSAAEQPGHLRVLLTDGEELVAMAPGGVGGPGHPLSDDEVVAKFVGNCGDHPRAQALAGRLLALQDEPSVRALVDDLAALIRDVTGP